MSDVVISIAAAEDLIVDVLCRHDCKPENAASVARALVAAEIDGQPGHGLSRLPYYAAQSASGKVDGQADPAIAGRRHGSLRINAMDGFAYPACDLAISELTALSVEYGVSAVSIFRSHHFGQAGFHAERLARQGLVALVFSNSPHAIAPWGGSKGLFGTNPIAFAAPRQDQLPLLIDLSLGKAARGKVMLARQRGECIPEGWALDEHGRPTTDPEAALNGTMLPIGDAKGAVLVLMVEILAAGLSGANFGYEASSFFTETGAPPGVGQMIMALDPQFFSGGLFSNRLEALISEILSQDGARLPGSGREARREKARTEGLFVPRLLLEQLLQLKLRSS